MDVEQGTRHCERRGGSSRATEHAADLQMDQSQPAKTCRATHTGEDRLVLKQVRCSSQGLEHVPPLGFRQLKEFSWLRPRSAPLLLRAVVKKSRSKILPLLLGELLWSRGTTTGAHLCCQGATKTGTGQGAGRGAGWYSRHTQWPHQRGAGMENGRSRARDRDCGQVQFHDHPVSLQRWGRSDIKLRSPASGSRSGLEPWWYETIPDGAVQHGWKPAVKPQLESSSQRKAMACPSF